MEPNPKPTLAPVATLKPSPEFSVVLKEEMAITAEMFQVQLSELMLLGYREALQDLKPQELRRGFRRARKMLSMFPRPAEVREQMTLASEEEEPKRYFLPEAPPFRTAAEMEEDRKTWEALKKQFGWDQKPPELPPEEIEKRKKMLREDYIRYLIGG